eukprot:TRINITY_DN11969_c0_g1_i4.p1 TRINITY_DN11969_c0_g1~~TRINITY_DN11969_c0_g1_i4.p1  ORF type:complete len:409 (-),score=50.46 TRINITY_DN11969_c0_g1_i4:281-1507(-)
MRMFSWTNSNNLRQLFFAFILSKLDYGLEAKADILDQLQILQNQALKEISQLCGNPSSLQLNQLHQIWRVKSVANRFKDLKHKTAGDLLTLDPSATSPYTCSDRFQGRYVCPWQTPSHVQCKTSYELNTQSSKDGAWFASEDCATKQGAQAFCDGSWRPDRNEGAIGGCLFIDNQLVKRFSKAYHYVKSSYRAELLALRKLLHLLNEIPESTSHVDIFSDSMSVIDRLTNVYSRPNQFCDPIILDILQRINDLQNWGIRITLNWIKAHVGVPGNELADSLCQSAYASDRHTWYSDTVSRDCFTPNAPKSSSDLPWELFKSRSSRTRRLLCRFLTGAGNVRSVTHHFIDSHNSKLCRFCFLAAETTDHLLLRCPTAGSPVYGLSKEEFLGSPKRWMETLAFCLSADIII